MYFLRYCINKKNKVGIEFLMVRMSVLVVRKFVINDLCDF